MLRNLFDRQRSYLDYYFQTIDVAQAEAIFQAFLHCKGLIVFTGIGKSGIIAEKIAATFVSTGTKALALPAINFLHGDIGILSEQDILVLFSKSGEAEELINLIPFARKRRTQIISIVSNEQSRLFRSSDLSICLPVEKELCPFDLAPTTSAEVQLLFGDALATALMEVKGFSIDEYAQNHPSGVLGKKMHLKVEDVMFKEDKVPLCRPEDRIVDILVELSNKRCGCLLVADEERRLLGIFTDGDLRRSLQAYGTTILEKKVSSLMSLNAKWVAKDLLAWEAIKIMQKVPNRWVMMMPVLDDGKIVGIIHMHDIIHTGLSK